MRSLPIALSLSLAVSLGLPSFMAGGATELSGTPVPGPGAVYQSVEYLLDALDAGDKAKAAKVLQPMAGDDGWQWTRNRNGELVDGPPGEATSGMSFVDVDAGGAVLVVDSRADLQAAVGKQIGGADAKSHIVSVHANCASQQCSWAHVVFERMFTRADGQRVQVPMQATALMRYQGEVPHMRIYHWHASATGPAQLLKDAGAVRRGKR